MEKEIPCFFLCILVCFLEFFAITESRQMCWTCQYVQNGAGRQECAVAPGNWTGGEPRQRCLSKCIISAQYDVATEEPLFLYRGCLDTTQKDGCSSTGNKHICFFSCEGQNYCNDKNVLKYSNLSDGAVRLTNHLEILIVVAAVILFGVFFCETHLA